jgi:Ca2+-binding EF-hand superfamily protein
MELASFLKKMKTTCTDDDVESFLFFFDKDGDREISINELQTAIRAFQRAQEQER